MSDDNRTPITRARRDGALLEWSRTWNRKENVGGAIWRE